jgi:hypothetical protein
MDRKEQDKQDNAIRKLVPVFQDLGYSRDYAVYIVLALHFSSTSEDYKRIFGERAIRALDHILEEI